MANCIITRSTTSNLDVYSTTETRIGTWIDGKPIYRRVFNIGIVSAGWYTVADASGMSIDKLIRADVNGHSSDMSLISVINEHIIKYSPSTKKIEFYGVIAYEQSCYLLLEYTKTTD